MPAELTHNRAYLAANRRLIIGRSLVAAAAGGLPVPVLEDWLVSRVQRGTIRKIADSRSVDADDQAVRAVADGSERPPDWAEIAGGTVLSRLLARQWRRLLLIYLVARRAQAATRGFLVGSLFDHYCARLHVGMGLDGPRGTELRALIDRAIAETPGGIGRRVFRRGVLRAARVGVRAPLKLADAVTGGMVRRLLSKNQEIEAVQVVDDAIEQQLKARKSFLSRSAAALELQLAAEANPYIERLLDNFDQLWRERQAGGEPRPDDEPASS
jgi:hypothetical protein